MLWRDLAPCPTNNMDGKLQFQTQILTCAHTCALNYIFRLLLFSNCSRALYHLVQAFLEQHFFCFGIYNYRSGSSLFDSFFSGWVQAPKQEHQNVEKNSLHWYMWPPCFFPLLGFPRLWTSTVRPTRKEWLPLVFVGLVAMPLMVPVAYHYGVAVQVCDFAADYETSKLRGKTSMETTKQGNQNY